MGDPLVIAKRLVAWASSWIETWRIAPPFSRRRRDLLEVIREGLAEDGLAKDDVWREVDRP